MAGYVTAGACRLACLLGVQQSFAKAERARAAVAGWELDDHTIRHLGHATAGRARAGRSARSTAAAFAQAAGDLELPIDAGKVHTLEGWRAVKVAVFDRRPCGEPTPAAAWDERDLPAPAVRSVVAAVEEASAFGPRGVGEAQRFGLTDPQEFSARGAGAEWVWNLVGEHCPGAAEVLDIWHGAEPLAAGAKAAYGQGSEAAQAQAPRGQQKLLEDGYWGVPEWVGELAGALPPAGDGAALGGVLNDGARHQERLNDARRRRGQAIGRGLVEGAIKQWRNKRLQQTGARWKVKHVGPFGELGALAAGPEWPAFWESN